ncbi:MAG: serpin family protein [Acutalibacteraceae bacterium]|nr:serpin family protein [Acutalibacteraceae bacterium]
MKKILSITAIVLCICLVFAGCNQTANVPVDLMTEITANKVDKIQPDDSFVSGQYGFSASLLKELAKSEKGNFMFSPLSLTQVLTLTANGAEGDTAKEILAVLGGTDLNKYNAQLKYYTDTLTKELLSVNSIWYKNDRRLSVKKEFLQTNADYFGAASRKISFDEEGRKLINDWVKESTAGNIDSIVDKIEKESIMYLINALTFESSWSTQYPDEVIAKGDFITNDGKTVSMDMMSSTESCYINYEGAKGFIKPYAMANYCFAAILPPENIEAGDYIASLDGEKLKRLIDSSEDAEVLAALPKFSFNYSFTANEALSSLGVKTAFNEDKADFSKMGKMDGGNIYLSDVLQKTYITVDNQGTKAGAVAKSEMAVKTSMPRFEKVTLNRPFVFMILDGVYNTPVFVGVVNNPAQ